MPKVRIKAGLTNVQLPNGKSYDGGKVVELTEEEYKSLAATALGDEVLDAGTSVPVPGSTNLTEIAVPVTLASIVDGEVTRIKPGFAGTIVGFCAVVTTAVTTAAKTTTLNLEINSVNVTGGLITVTSAAATPVGAKIVASAITAANAFTAEQEIKIEAASTTAFVEGKVTLFVLVKAS